MPQWARLVVGMEGRAAKGRFEQLSKRVAFDTSSLGFDDVVDRLLFLLERAHRERGHVDPQPSALTTSSTGCISQGA